MVQEMSLRLKNCNDQVWSSRPNTMDSEAVLQAIETNSASRTEKVSGKLGISVQYGLSPSQLWQKYSELSHITKILQNF